MAARSGRSPQYGGDNGRQAKCAGRARGEGFDPAGREMPAAGGRRTHRGARRNNLGLAGCDRFEIGHPRRSRVRGAEWLNSWRTGCEDG